MSDPARAHVFVDTEYDRLDTATANLLEIAWAIEDHPVVSGIPPHTIDGHDPRSLEINGYWKRNLADKTAWDRDIIDITAKMTAGLTVVGANPRVDAHILSRFIGYEPWHYRLCDVESVAYLLLGFDQTPGLRQIKDKLAELGYELPDPDHSAGGDVETLRAVFRILQRIARYLLRQGLPEAKQLAAYERAATTAVIEIPTVELLPEIEVRLPAVPTYVGTASHPYLGDQALCVGVLGGRSGDHCLLPADNDIHRPRAAQ